MEFDGRNGKQGHFHHGKLQGSGSAIPDPNPHTDPNAHVSKNGCGSDTNANSNSYACLDSNRNATTKSDTNANSYVCLDSNRNATTKSDPNANSDTHYHRHANANANANANPCFNTGRDSYTDADTKEEISEGSSSASFAYAYPLISSSTINQGPPIYEGEVVYLMPAPPPDPSEGSGWGRGSPATLGPTEKACLFKTPG